MQSGRLGLREKYGLELGLAFGEEYGLELGLTLEEESRPELGFEPLVGLRAAFGVGCGLE